VSPAFGAIGDPVTVTGTSWSVGETVSIAVKSTLNQGAGRIDPQSVLARVKVDRNGRFKAAIRLPNDPSLQSQTQAWVVATTANGRNQAMAPIQIVGSALEVEPSPVASPVPDNASENAPPAETQLPQP
jgi:hypothetical protein